MEDFITEKFALLNLIKALQGLSATGSAESGRDKPAESAASEIKPAAAEQATYNAMAEVIARHESISNRVRSAKKQ